VSRFEDDEEPEDTSDREVSAALTVGEGDIDASLRPRSLREFIGQPRVREQLQLVLEGAKNRGGTPDHILLSGPPGLGKTSLAMIIAAELGTSLRVTSGPALERAGDLAAMLSNLVEHDVLFIDEIHRIARPAEEMLYLAMEDFRVDVVAAGKGPGRHVDSGSMSRRSRRRATTVGRADRPAARSVGFTAHMDFIEPAELSVCWFARPASCIELCRCRRRDRPSLPWHATHRQPCCSATTPRSAPTG
jgi:Holliday junction DNA helicase RuvB